MAQLRKVCFKLQRKKKILNLQETASKKRMAGFEIKLNIIHIKLSVEEMSDVMTAHE